MPVNPLKDPYILEGRIVTMSPNGIIDDGTIYIKEGNIEAVKAAAKAAPAGFAHAERIRTGDTIYPGLIELHNHLSYNVMPLWDVPKKYANNGQWRGSDGYRREITKPSQVIGATPGLVEALVRFVEMRALLGGVTTSQGISLSSEPGIKKYYKGLVRNVEQPVHPALPRAGTKIGNPDSGKAEHYLNTLKKNTCYLQHLSEGIDNIARGWFLRLQMENGDWAINDAFCGIHSTALNEDDFHIISERGGSMIWSPLSNYLLYGETADLRAAKSADILIGLGSDWAPSGSKNLLGELKVAWLASEQQGAVFTPEELISMVTVNPARIARWDNQLGSIESGKRADLVSINGQSGDDFMRMIEARETSVTMVVIDGVPRVGQTRLMAKFGPGTEKIEIGRSTRVLNLAQQDADPLVAQLSLTEATRRLKSAMAHLPDLAVDLESAQGDSLFSGSVDSAGTKWRIAFDMEDDDDVIETALGVGGKPLSSYVTEAMELEPITVVDDHSHLRKLVAARNLPEFVKKGLPPLYGERIPLPSSGEFLEKTAEKLAAEVLSTTQSLATFLRSSGELRLKDRKHIVAQAMLVIGENYVHLPLKRTMHAVDPLQRLRLLKHQLSGAVEGDLPPEIEFHNELSDIFNSLRDLHTAYRLPQPFMGKSAWLPFFIEEIEEHGCRKYIVTKVIGNAGPELFKAGVEVTHWNGMPIHQAVLHNAEHHAGSNEAARHARGINSLTIRPLARGLPPEEEWVALRYIDEQGTVHEWAQEWFVFEPRAGANSIPPDGHTREASAIGLDDHTDDIQQTKKVLFAPGVADLESEAGLEKEGRRADRIDAGIETVLPGVFRARQVQKDGKNYGYVRIFSFNVRDADAFVNEFVRLVEQLPANGLIIDVRGNGGGLIYAAEQLLQVLTPRRIEPQRAQFLNSTTNLQICRNHSNSTRFPGLELGDWIKSIKQSVETGATFSLGYPITDPARCNNLGQRYFGPAILIVDPLCYSATDIFAAGFQDHSIGPILGVGENTGAGGANVWSHGLLMELMKPDQLADVVSPYKPMPHGSDLRVAIRRTVRVGPNAGDVVEDLGIKPDYVHHMTREDVMNNNVDLVSSAIDLVSDRKPHTIKLVVERFADRRPAIKIKTGNVDQVDATIGPRQTRSLYPHRGLSRIELEDELGDVDGDTVTIEVRGYEHDQLVVRRRQEIPLT